MSKNKKLLFLLTCFFLIFITNSIAEEKPEFRLEIEQGGRNFDVSRGIINLKKAPFSIRFIFNQPMAVQVAAGLRANRYLIAKGNAPLHAFMPPASGLAEGLFNEKKSVFIADAIGTNYWYYSNDHNHRFDEVRHEKNSIICIRTIENIMSGNEQIPIEKAEISKIYFVFVNARARDRLGDEYIEYQRIPLIINFTGTIAGNEKPSVMLERPGGTDATQKSLPELPYAARKGDIIKVLELLSHGADIETREENGWTALIVAARKGNLDLVKLLLEKGANIEASGHDGTALSGAAGNGKLEIVRFLLKKGANIEARDENGWTALMWAAIGGEDNVVRLLLEKGANIEAKSNNNWTAFSEDRGWTALMSAADWGKVDVARILLENGAKIEVKDDHGFTALIWAAFANHADIVQFLLEKGANLEASDNNGNTALIWAARNGCTDVVKLLIEKNADIEAKDNKGWTAVKWAANNDRAEIVNLLIDKGANIPAEYKKCPAPSVAVANAPQYEIKVIDAGTGPRKLLRYEPNPGFRETTFFRMQMTMRVKVDGVITKTVRVPRMDVNSVVESEGFTDRGDLIVQSRVKSVDFVPGPNATAEELELARNVKTRIKNSPASRFLANSSGMTQLPDNGPRQAGQNPALEFTNANPLGYATPLFPDVPVGKGAVWTVTSKPVMLFLSGTVVATFTLEDIEGSTALLRVSTSVQGSSIMPVAMQLPKMRATGENTMHIDFRRVVPTSSAVQSRVKVEIPIPKGQQAQQAEIEIDMQIEQSSP